MSGAAGKAALYYLDGSGTTADARTRRSGWGAAGWVGRGAADDQLASPWIMATASSKTQHYPAAGRFGTVAADDRFGKPWFTEAEFARSGEAVEE